MTLRASVLFAAALFLAAGTASGQYCEAGGPPCRSPNCNSCEYTNDGQGTDRYRCEYAYRDGSCGCGWDAAYTQCWNVGVCNYLWWGGCDENWQQGVRNEKEKPGKAYACWPWEPHRAVRRRLMTSG